MKIQQTLTIKIVALAASLVGLGFCCQPATAQTIITSSSSPALAGNYVETFSSAITGNYTSLTLNQVTFTAPGDQFAIDTTYAGSYNSQGKYLENDQGVANEIKLTFATPTSVFGFNYGALDNDWTLSAYTAQNVLIDSTIVAPNFASNAGEFIGIQSPSANIAYATFTDSGSGDYILLDNVSYAAEAAPEPSTWALLLGGIGLIAFLRKSIRGELTV